MPISRPHKITHPLADRVSVQDSGSHYCTPGVSSELAFFKDGKWVCDPVAEFAEYHDGTDMPVYGWVPNDLVDAFLAKYAGGAS